MKNVLLWLILLVSITLKGQETAFLTSQNHDALDSLMQKTYAELRKTFYKQNDKAIKNHYGNAYIEKAKREKDTIEIANGYDLLCKYYFTDNTLAVKYVDSIISITKNVKHKYYPSRGYLNKGILLVHSKQYKEALVSYLKAEKFAKENNNISHQIAIKHNIGVLKALLNKTEEALNAYKENLKFLQSNQIENEHEIIHVGTLSGLARSYNKLKALDSANFYVRKGIEESNKMKVKYYYDDLLLESGINNTLRHNNLEALDSLYKAEKFAPDSKTVNTKSISRMYIGKNLYKLNRKEEAVVYLKKVDSAITSSNYVLEVRDAFELLINHYKEENDTENQLRLLEKLISLDNETHQKHRDLNIDITKKYDTKLLIQDRNLLTQKLDAKKGDMKRTFLFISILLMVLSILFFWYYKNQKLRTKTVQTLLEKKQQIIQNSISKSKGKKSPEIAPELMNELSAKLGAFQDKKRFLNPNISLASSAKELKTNSTYLSKVINQKEGKNFANYINDLRIDYVTKMLNEDPKYRLYSVVAIAKEAGFNNAKSFSRAFLKRTGEHASVFIKKLDSNP